MSNTYDISSADTSNEIMKKGKGRSKKYTTCEESMKEKKQYDFEYYHQKTSFKKNLKDNYPKQYMLSILFTTKVLDAILVDQMFSIITGENQ